MDGTSSVFYVAPHYDKNALTPKMCKDGCASAGPGLTLAGITQGNIANSCLLLRTFCSNSEVAVEPFASRLVTTVRDV